MPSGSSGSGARRRTRASSQRASQDSPERIDSSASRKGRSSSHASTSDSSAGASGPQRRRATSGTRSSGAAVKRHNPRDASGRVEDRPRSHNRTRTGDRTRVREDGATRPRSHSQSRDDGYPRSRSRSRDGGNPPRSHARTDRSSNASARRPSGPRPASHRRETRRIPIIPVLAFVALAAIGIFTAGMNSGPQYDAIISVPGEALAATQAAEAQAAQEGDGQPSDVQQDGNHASDQENGDGSQQGQETSGQATDGQQADADADDPQLAVEVADADGNSQVKVEVADASQQLDLAAIPSSEEVSTFSAGDGSAPSLSQQALDPINAAFSKFTDGGIDAGFVFMNLDTGAGIAANADQKVYGASSIKGPFVTYLCESLIDGEEITTDTMCASMNDNFSRNGSASVGSLITNTITLSSNGAFGSLSEQYSDSDYDNWLESVGVDPGIYERADYFAWYTARDAAKLWTETYDYLGSGSETADWLAGLMEDTNVSYIRDGASALKTQLTEDEWQMPPMQSSPTKLIRATADSVSGYQSKTAILDGVKVANKAGWCVDDASDSVDYDSTSDNGIVTIDGQDYLLCIMTGSPYSDNSAQNVANLAASLIAVYDEVV